MAKGLFFQGTARGSNKMEWSGNSRAFRVDHSNHNGEMARGLGRPSRNRNAGGNPLGPLERPHQLIFMSLNINALRNENVIKSGFFEVPNYLRAHVRLIDEGIDVWRPCHVYKLDHLHGILLSKEYDFIDLSEKWECNSGDIVQIIE